MRSYLVSPFALELCLAAFGQVPNQQLTDLSTIEITRNLVVWFEHGNALVVNYSALILASFINHGLRITGEFGTSP